MASRAETIRITLRKNRDPRKYSRALASATREWFRKGQLGTSSTTDMGRYTGARF